MNLNIYFKKLFILIMFFCTLYNITYGTQIIGRDMRKEVPYKLDINIVTEGEMLKEGISSGYVDKIINYRDIVGGFSKLDELKRISGVRDKVLKKLEIKFWIKTGYKMNKISINIADDITLKYFGFLPKEIKILRKKLDIGEYIDNNLELKEFIKNEKRYEELRDIVEYNRK